MLETFEPRNGGRWRYIQKDQSGNEFGFHGVYQEVLAPQRIIDTFEFEGLPEKGHVALETLTLEEVPGGRNRLTAHSVFQSVADRDGALQSGMEERVTWRENASKLPTESLVFIDECGSNIALTPVYARAPKGERARGSVPRNRGKNTMLIAALSLEGMGAAMILEESANTTAFELYVKHVLAPSLHAGQIVVMDNLQAHKSARVKQTIEAKGCQLLFLPGYSPDLSPIEEAFSKLKTALLVARARTREALQEAIGQALLTITAQDAHGWFQHCGYSLPQERKR